MTTGIAPALLLAPTPGGGSTLVPLLVQFALIFAIFFFLIIRPQQRQRKQHELALQNIKKGDEIVTAGGIIGEVVHIARRDTGKDGQPAPVSMEDRVTIRSGDSRLIVERGRIARVASKTAESTSAA